MAIKAAAPALIVAALALVGDYSTLSRQAGTREVREASAPVSGLSNLGSVIAKVTEGWLELDSIYAKTVATLVNADTFDEGKYLKNIELLKAVRQLENDLNGANVPTAFNTEHLALRRAVAKVRTRMVAIHGLYQQFSITPDVFQSELSGEGLRDLADHTTLRLGHLA
ncbi:hypothetical protein [Pseudomonas sp. CC120222-01a]|uniref:hypothetical protein n=1 Tax=Pseudomonas sp. CC120222-01a TaxID=1378075 RepID=UPI000D9B19D1|nr:hypothetical protein [Pseudomonas sp. CC120222-01a]PVZ43910.1 hypothetical protein N430_00392 [Pseudomonas sp. CC120222-01a]